MTSSRHTYLEDLQALLAGTLLVSLGITLFIKANLVTGGTAGIAFLGHYATGLSFGLLFFLINLPFYWLALKKMGWEFVLKTFASVALLSAFSELLPSLVQIDWVYPAYAAITGGVLIGVGFLILFRHRASLGGINVLVLYLQERYGLRAGTLQLAFDSLILLASVPVISMTSIGLSLLAAVVLNLVLALNHKPGRYMAV